ncbi:MAG TPA: hypothetical protein VHC23_07305 [Jatrophihabitans sp.]|nr:hypothetical protein [Jatrophihabitans sp.]
MHRTLLAGLTATLAIAGTAHAAGSPRGSLSLSPAFVEHEATPGAVGAVKVANSSAKTLAVTVSARPWLQGRDGAVRADVRRSLTQVKLAATTFKLAPGQARSVPITLRATPRAGSLYGAIEVIGSVQGARAKNGVLVRYRLLGGLRLNPVATKRRLHVQIGTARVVSRKAVLPVRNDGNTALPIGGSAQVKGTTKGATGTVRSTIAAHRILPGSTVELRLVGKRLKPGSYRATVTLRQGDRRVAQVTRSFRVR